MDPFETFEHAGFTIELHTDDDPSAPSDWDELGTLYGLPFLHFGFRGSGLDNMRGVETADSQAVEANERGGAKLMCRYLRVARKEIVVPVRFSDYGSSGSRLHATDEDDDRCDGYMSTTLERCEELGVKPEDALDALRGEIKTWDAYFEGRVIGVVVRDSDGEIAESVWGFYPDEEGDGYDYARQEGRDMAEGERDQRRRRQQEIAAGWTWAHKNAVTA